jgi:hypothetical protein
VRDGEVSRWFDEYLAAFAACGRGERDAGELLAYYGLPLLVATDDGFVALTTEQQVVGIARQQVDAMRAASYDHSEVLQSEVNVVNATLAVYHGEFSRVRGDGGEIGRLAVTYLVTESSAGRRISALAVHSQ